MLNNFAVYSLRDETILANAREKENELKEKYSFSRLLDSIRPKGVLIEDIAEGAVEALECLEISGEVYLFALKGAIPTATIYLENKNDWVEVRSLLREAGLSR